MDIVAIKTALDLVELGRKALQRVKSLLRKFVVSRAELDKAKLEARTAEAEREACRVELERLKKADENAAAELAGSFAPFAVGLHFLAFVSKADAADPRAPRRIVCPRCLARGVVADLSKEVRARHVLGAKPKKTIYFACSDPACAYHFAATELAVEQALKRVD